MQSASVLVAVATATGALPRSTHRCGATRQVTAPAPTASRGLAVTGGLSWRARKCAMPTVSGRPLSAQHHTGLGLAVLAARHRCHLTHSDAQKGATDV